jgi:hypothetical protein
MAVAPSVWQEIHIKRLQEAAMTPKLFSTLIIIVVATGTAIIPLAGGSMMGTEPMRTVFFAFLSAIIAIQLVPAVLLVGSLIKNALFENTRKQEHRG